MRRRESGHVKDDRREYDRSDYLGLYREEGSAPGTFGLSGPRL